MRTKWKKTANSRIDMPDYCERSYFEALVNGLVHRDYLINGSEVHIDMFDDRLTIYSPGGMPDGTIVQNRIIDAIPSTRRNPVLADVFQRLGYMERKGSGLTKIIEAYKAAYNYSEEKEPQFLSSRVEFTVTLKNLNYGVNEANNEAKSESKKANNEAKSTDEVKNIILNAIADNPNITQKELERISGVSRSTVQRIMEELTKIGKIRRIGAKRGGYWDVMV
jgi:predicted HTH transcriptional regulator